MGWKGVCPNEASVTEPELFEFVVDELRLQTGSDQLEEGWPDEQNW